jgi:hypothetical protein
MWDVCGLGHKIIAIYLCDFPSLSRNSRWRDTNTTWVFLHICTHKTNSDTHNVYYTSAAVSPRQSAVSAGFSLAIRGVCSLGPSARTSRLQIGQSRLRVVSQGVLCQWRGLGEYMHCSWNSCWQGKVRTMFPSVKSSRQTTHSVTTGRRVCWE